MKTLPRRPRLEPLEDRQTPADLGAVRDPALFDQTKLGPGDDNSSSEPIDLNFTINFLGSKHPAVYVNNNGNLTFDAPLSVYDPPALGRFNFDIIAPFFADVDTRNNASGEVLYGTGTIDGHKAFAVTWDGVGYYNARADLLDRFQAVIIDRSDLGAGDFDLELNYDQIEWDVAEDIDHGARVGFANGEKFSFELPGSGERMATLDSSELGLSRTRTGSPIAGRHLFLGRDGTITANLPPRLDVADVQLVEGESLHLPVAAADPDGGRVVYSLDAGGSGATIDPQTGLLTLLAAAPGEYSLVVTATDGYGLATSVPLDVHVVNVPPAVRVGGDVLLSRGDAFARNVTFADPGTGAFTATADFGDGTGLVTLNRNADGSFALAHDFLKEGSFTVSVTVNDGHDPTTRTFTVNVLPDVSKVTVSRTVPLTPGQATTLDLTDPGTGRTVAVTVGRSADAAADGAVTVTFYTDNPTGVPSGLGRLCFDVQMRNADDDDLITIDYGSRVSAAGLQVKFFDDLLRKWLPVPATIERTPTGLRLTVLDTSIFNGTVFAVGVASPGTTVTTPVQPPVASNGGTSGSPRTVTDASAATGTAIQFTSRTQLTLTVSAVQDRQLTSGSAVANQSGGNRTVTLSSTAGVGGSEEVEEKKDEKEPVKPAGAEEEKKKEDEKKKAKPAVEETGDVKPREVAPDGVKVEKLPPPREEESEESEEEAAQTSWAWALSPLLAVPSGFGRRKRRE